MAARCTDCGKEISTWQEASTLGTRAVTSLWEAVKGSMMDLLSTLTLGGVSGVVAGPLNEIKATCPHSGSTGRWVDV